MDSEAKVTEDRTGVWGVLVAVALLGATGLSVFYMLPLFIGAAAKSLGLSSQQQGLVGSMDVAGIAVAGLLSLAWVGRMSWRRAAMLGMVAFAAINLASAFVDNLALLCVLRFLAGVGGGTVFAVFLACMGSMPNPHRAFGITITMHLLWTSVTIQPTSMAISRAGLDGMLYFLAGLAVLVSPALIWTPVSPRSSDEEEGAEEEGQTGAIGWRGYASLLSVLTLMAAVGAAWAFAERIGTAKGLGPETIANAFSLAYLVCIAGPILAAWIGGSRSLTIPVVLGCLTTALATLLFYYDVLPTYALQFAVAAILFQVSWNFCSPLQLGVIARADPQRRLIASTGFASATGTFLGPAFGGLLVGAGGYAALVWVGAGLAAAACLLLMPAARQQHEIVRARSSGVGD